MARTYTRREVLIGASSTMLLPVACSQGGDAPDSVANTTFLHGVASGDPDSTSVVVWTRVSNATGTSNVDWRVATDDTFQNVIANGKYSTDETRDYTVKVVVNGLSPGQEYFYQFDVDGIRSPVGRTKTLPTGHVERLVLAVATCSKPSPGSPFSSPPAPRSMPRPMGHGSMKKARQSPIARPGGSCSRPKAR